MIASPEVPLQERLNLSVEEREEMIELGLELLRLLLEGPGPPEGHRVFVLEVVSRYSADRIREMISNIRGVRLDVAKLAKLPAYAVFEVLRYVRRGAGREDFRISRLMAFGGVQTS